MAELESLVSEALVRDLVKKKYTHRQISDYIKTLTPSTRGVSPRSVERYCAVHNIHYRNKNITREEVNSVVADAVKEVRFVWLIKRPCFEFEANWVVNFRL